MKKLITEIKEESGAVYQLWAELTPNAIPAGYKTLEFSSIWTGAKDPKLPQSKSKFMFNPEALTNLKELLGSE